MKRNVASQSVGAQMTSASDGSAFTGAVSVAVTKDNGTQTAGGGTAPAHEGNGYHSYSPTQAETDADHIAFTFTGTGAIPVTVQVYTTFPQTGDNFARLGTPAGASISADIAVIEAQTDDIGAAGAGLTAVPWNSAWDAEVQSEVADALDAAVPATPTADSINERIKTMDDADMPSRLPAALVGGRIAANAEVVGDKTGYSIGTGGIASTSFAAGAIDAAAIATDAIGSAELAAAAAEKIADALINRNVAGGSNTGRLVKDALRYLRNRVAIAAGTMTVYQEDDTNAAWTAAVTTSAGDPISEINPA